VTRNKPEVPRCDNCIYGGMSFDWNGKVECKKHGRIDCKVNPYHLCGHWDWERASDSNGRAPRPLLQFCGEESLGVQIDGDTLAGDEFILVGLIDSHGEEIHQPPAKLARNTARECAFEILRRV
jgi:hypothetical protein